MGLRNRGWLLCMLALGACEPTAVDVDAGAVPDAGLVDASSVDAALLDAGTLVDAGPVDAGAAIDAGDAGLTTTTVVIRYAGTAGAISVRGSGGPLSWTTGAETVAGADDTYVWQTTELDAPIELKPLLGDVWARGPNYHVAPGDHVEITPRFEGDAGHVETLFAAYRSTILGGERAVYAYLPAAYDENSAARFPVVYMHDGQNLFDPALAFGGRAWEVDEAMDAAAGAGLCPDAVTTCQDDAACGGARCETFREAIIIGVANGGAARIDEYTPTVDAMYGGGRGGDYIDALVDELQPMVDAALRTRTGPEETGLVGSSLGGLISSWGGVERPDVFGLVGALSPSTWWDERTLLSVVATIPSRPARAVRVYVDSGDSGPASGGWMDTSALAEAYRTAGFRDDADLRYVLAPGHEHNETYWRQRIGPALGFLLGPRERPLP